MANKLYSERLAKRLPDGMTLPIELVRTLDWLEAQGWVQSFTGKKKPNKFKNRFVSIYPPELMDAPGASFVTFETTSLKHTQFWSTPDPAVDARIFEIARTSGDGGRVALWLDADGKQWFVHLGHDELGIISDDPVTLLTFLAMGYLEPGGFADTTQTPLQNALEYYGYDSVDELDADDDEAPPLPPLLFREFLADTFGVTHIPDRASDLGINPFVAYEDPTTSDPFAAWINHVTPEPTAEELAEIKKLSEMAEGMTEELEALTKDLDDPNLLKKLENYFATKFKM